MSAFNILRPPENHAYHPKIWLCWLHFLFLSVHTPQKHLLLARLCTSHADDRLETHALVVVNARADDCLINFLNATCIGIFFSFRRSRKLWYKHVFVTGGRWWSRQLRHVRNNADCHCVGERRRHGCMFLVTTTSPSRLSFFPAFDRIFFSRFWMAATILHILIRRKKSVSF